MVIGGVTEMVCTLILSNTNIFEFIKHKNPAQINGTALRVRCMLHFHSQHYKVRFLPGGSVPLSEENLYQLSCTLTAESGVKEIEVAISGDQWTITDIYLEVSIQWSFTSTQKKYVSVHVCSI